MSTKAKKAPATASASKLARKNALPARAGQPFTSEEDARICELHAQGKSVTEIAAELNRTNAGIIARLEQLSGQLAKPRESDKVVSLKIAGRTIDGEVVTKPEAPAADEAPPASTGEVVDIKPAKGSKRADKTEPPKEEGGFNERELPYDAVSRPENAITDSYKGPRHRIGLSMARLKASLTIAPKKENREVLNSVHLRAIGNELTIYSTDGKQVIASRMWSKTPWPDYLTPGVTMERASLALALAHFSKHPDLKACEQVIFEYAEGQQHGYLIDLYDLTRFRIPLLKGDYPVQLTNVIESASRAILGGESSPLTSNLGLGTDYMKQATAVASVLGVKAIRVIAPLEVGQAWVILYPRADGVLHLVMATALEATLDRRTLGMIGNTNLKGTMAALKATVTMKQRALEGMNESSPQAKRHQEVIDSCKERMKEVERAMADTATALPAPAKAAAKSAVSTKSGPRMKKAKGKTAA